MVIHMIENWMKSLFVSKFTEPEFVLRAMDCFINEGSKVLVRFAVAGLKQHQSQIEACNDLDQVNQSCRRLECRISNYATMTDNCLNMV